VIQRIHCGLFRWFFLILAHPHCLCHSLLLQVDSIWAVIVITKITERRLSELFYAELHTAAACNHRHACMSSSYKASTSVFVFLLSQTTLFVLTFFVYFSLIVSIEFCCQQWSKQGGMALFPRAEFWQVILELHLERWGEEYELCHLVNYTFTAGCQ